MPERANAGAGGGLGIGVEETTGVLLWVWIANVPARIGDSTHADPRTRHCLLFSRLGRSATAPTGQGFGRADALVVPVRAQDALATRLER